MQKLLRRTPHGPPLLCTAANNTPLSPSPPFHTTRPSLLSFPLAMTAATAAVGSIFAAGDASSYSSSSFCRNSIVRPYFAQYRCSIDSGNSINRTRYHRPWVGFKEERKLGFQSAWFKSASNGMFAAVNGLETSIHVEEDGGGEGGSGVLTEEDKIETSKPLRPHRRQRGSSSSSGGGGGDEMAMVDSPDLLTIPGVGPRNLRKLVQKGIGGVAELKQLYKDKFFGKSNQTMVEYLQSSVGIIHKNHAESITTYIKDSVDEELKEEHGSNAILTPKKRLTFCVEGNISVGKSTFLQRIANETIELRDLVEVVPEPVNKWQDIGPDHFNILNAFYAEPQRYAYTFQNYVFVTRVMQEKESSGGIKPLRLMERSVFSDRMTWKFRTVILYSSSTHDKVFVRAVHEAKWMSEMEISIYDSWFDPVVSCLPGLIPDAFIYLRASPDTCHKRMMQRKRVEEGGVSLDYLRDLHEKHESWLFPLESVNHGRLSFNKLPFHVDNSMHPDIRDQVFYLEGDHMHSSIQKVPALVLDCEPNIDFSKDIEAKSQYARQVAEFFEFVKKKNEADLAKVGEDALKVGRPQVVLPPGGGMWLPDGKNFPESALKSLEFRRAMSLVSG